MSPQPATLAQPRGQTDTQVFVTDPAGRQINLPYLAGASVQHYLDASETILDADAMVLLGSKPASSDTVVPEGSTLIITSPVANG